MLIVIKLSWLYDKISLFLETHIDVFTGEMLKCHSGRDLLKYISAKEREKRHMK
jgi:hypothetical protein